MSRVKPKNEIPILSFFTGGGFLDLGFEQAGFKTIWYNEFNADFADMFEFAMSGLRKSNNHNSEKVFVNSRSSIADLTPEFVKSDAFNGEIPDIYGIIGGPPCPDFSVGGKNLGRDGDHGKLSKTYIDMICELRPSFFLMENVPGLIRNRKHKEYFSSLRSQLHDSDYITDFTTLDALNFGAPQQRNRVFLVGFLKNNSQAIKPLLSNALSDGWFPFPKSYYSEPLKHSWPKSSIFGGNPIRSCLKTSE